MEPIWQQVDDLATFEAPELCAGEALSIEWKQHRCLNSEMMDAVYMHQNRLDDKIFHHLPMNGLVDARTMLDTEDRQDIILGTERSLAYQEEEEDSIMEASHRTIVDDEDDLL
jgi:hypothetical protein